MLCNEASKGFLFFCYSNMITLRIYVQVKADLKPCLLSHFERKQHSHTISSYPNRMSGSPVMSLASHAFVFPRSTYFILCPIPLFLSKLCIKPMRSAFADESPIAISNRRHSSFRSILFNCSSSSQDHPA